MKRIIIPFLVGAATLVSACSIDHLEIPQKGVVTTDDYYKTDADAQSALIAAYAGFQRYVCGANGGNIYCPFRSTFNLPGDDMYAAGDNADDNSFMPTVNEYYFDAAAVVLNNCYKNLYIANYYSNLVIQYFGNVENPSEVMKNAVAEARVMRAFIHMMLAIGWDNPPFVDHILAGDALPYNCDKDPENPMSHNDLLKWCAAECSAALPNLDERQSPNDKNGCVKVTKGFANAVAGKALLFAGDYAGAKAYFKTVIDSGKYELVPGKEFADMFHVEGDCNSEKIFELNLEKADGLGFAEIQHSTWMEANIWAWRSDHFVVDPGKPYTGIDGWGGCGIPQSYADEFLANDGPDSYRFKATMVPIDELIYNTTYGLDDVDKLSVEEKKTSTLVGINAKGLYGQSFYLPLKQLIRWTDGRNKGDGIRMNNYIIMRYAEVLLMYAECCVNTNDSAEALKYVNEIQKRAGSKTISSSVDMDVIEKEKKLELWLEGCRWADCVRWNKTSGLEKNGSAVTTLYDKLHREPAASDENVKFYDKDNRFYTVETHVHADKGNIVGFKKGKHEHFPYPLDVVNKNPNLQQNPGY